MNAWEGKVYKYGLESLRQAGCNVEGLKFDPNMVIRGLIIDKERGNLVKVDRFGYVVYHVDSSIYYLMHAAHMRPCGHPDMSKGQCTGQGCCLGASLGILTAAS